MESLSYLASLVANRLEGDYIKLGLDVAGYRDKRENDLTVLAQRIGNKVRKTGRSFAMEPMNPTSAASSTLPSARWRVCAARARARAVTAAWSSTPPHRMLRLRIPTASAVAVAATGMAVVPAATATAVIAVSAAAMAATVATASGATRGPRPSGVAGAHLRPSATPRAQHP